MEIAEKLQIALNEATASLSDEIRIEHWVAAKHGPNPWQAVYFAHLGDDSLETLTMLLFAYSLVDMREKVKGLLLELGNLEHQDKPKDLSLSKMRR